MRARTRTGVNVGGSSILVIFVLLCLTTFATLSMVSANADYNLTKKAALSAEQYYQADSQAEEVLQEIDLILEQAAAAAGNSQAYFGLCDDLLGQQSWEWEMFWVWDADSMTISYQIPIGETQALSVAVDVQYPAREAQRYQKTRWQVISTQQLDLEEDTLDLWDGGEFGGMLAFWDGEE